MRTYQPIWERIRANPGKRVPIEVPAIYLSRLLKAVNKEKDQDHAYRNVRATQNKTGVMYKSTAPHPTREGFLICTFVLREYDTLLSFADKQQVRRRQPPLPGQLANDIGLAELELVAFDFIPTANEVIRAQMQMGMELAAANKDKAEK
jgi:hypothetical protein